MSSTSGTLPTVIEANSNNPSGSVKPKLRKSSSLLSKFTNPLAALSNLKSPRSGRKFITDYYIRLNEPHREYSPGDVVEGSVIVTVEKEVRITHLVVTLVGRVDIYGVAAYNVGKKKSLNYAGPVEYEGGVVLCRDQQVLCGDGRLEPGVYEFGFVLELSGKRLPSSLDFEKGSISYNISATLTRPITISPTRTCNHKVALVEMIDVASLPSPKPRVIPMEHGSKRSRLKSSHGSSDEKGPLKSGTRPSSIISTPNGSNPRISLDSASITTIGNRSQHKAGATATIELLKAGCLRGETIPLKISINHTKPIKSMHGIIVTLVRQGRFDTYPIITPSSTKSSASSLKKGLSLTSGGSTTTFRKDLSQVILPLIVDPRTLAATVKANIRVPEDAFPTINNIPSQIVSFRYYIEVLVDLGGKLAGKEEYINGVGMVNIPGATNGELGTDGAKLTTGPVDGSGMMAVYGAKVVETDRIRREIKNVVSCRYEVIVGTTDSASGMGRRRPTIEPSNSDQAQNQEQPTELIIHEEQTVQYHDGQAPGYNDYEEETLRSIVLQSNIGSPEITTAPVTISLSPMIPSFDDVALPPPDMMALDDKTRMRLAEQALLPSEPPGFTAGSASTAPFITSQNLPSVPPITEDDISRSHLPYHIPSAPPADMFGERHMDSVGRNQSAQNLGEDEDKAELERRRLLAIASAPPITAASGSRIASSAPFLTEDGDLPRYER
ncbi:pH-response regulator protein palF/RIM8 [Peziza echinospora]|nr:pH-response regulator protein palF/RIM8 [Peziza echinospora]